jgi:hypothetical protein
MSIFLAKLHPQDENNLHPAPQKNRQREVLAAVSNQARALRFAAEDCTGRGCLPLQSSMVPHPLDLLSAFDMFFFFRKLYRSLLHMVNRLGEQT